MSHSDEGAVTDPNSADPLLLTVPQAARLLGIGTTLAYELTGTGKLPHIRLGRALRIPRRALEDWIKTNTHTNWSGVTQGDGPKRTSGR